RTLVPALAVALVAGTALAVDPSGSPGPEASLAEPSVAALAPSGPSASPPDGAASVAPSEAPPSLEASEPASASSAPATVEQAQPSAPAATGDEDEGDDADDAGEAPTADRIAEIVARLTAAGIPATAVQVQELAGKVGVGGAIRTLAFADASGKT